MTTRTSLLFVPLLSLVFALGCGDDDGAAVDAGGERDASAPTDAGPGEDAGPDEDAQICTLDQLIPDEHRQALDDRPELLSYRDRASELETLVLKMLGNDEKRDSDKSPSRICLS